MADMSKMEARIKVLEARRKKGESVPELDALYERMDAATSKAYKESSKGLSGDYTGEKSKAGESAIENMKEYGMKKGGMTASKVETGMKKVKKMALGGMGSMTAGSSPRRDPSPFPDKIINRPNPSPFPDKIINRPNPSPFPDKIVNRPMPPMGPVVNRQMKKGGAVKTYATGNVVKSSASKRADGCAQRGKTKGRMV